MILKLNEPQNNLQLIQLENGFIVVDLVAEIDLDNTYVNLIGKIAYHKRNNKFDIIRDIDDKRVTFTNTVESTLTGDLPSDNLIINGYIVYEPIFASQSIIEQYNMSDVKVIEEDDIENLAKKQVEIEGWGEYTGTSEQVGIKNAFIEGYNQAKKDTYTLEQVKEFTKWIANTKIHGYAKQLYEAMLVHKVGSIEELIHLYFKTYQKVEITFDENNQPLNCKLL